MKCAKSCVRGKPIGRGLTKREFRELVEVIESMEVVDCFGVSDCRLRQRLERKATESQLKKAWKKATRGTDMDFEDAYD